MKNDYKSLDDLPLYISAPQLADVLGVSRAQAYMLYHRQDFPSIRVGERRLVVSKKALIKWLDEREETGI